MYAFIRFFSHLIHIGSLSFSFGQRERWEMSKNEHDWRVESCVSTTTPPPAPTTTTATTLATILTSIIARLQRRAGIGVSSGHETKLIWFLDWYLMVMDHFPSKRIAGTWEPISEQVLESSLDGKITIDSYDETTLRNEWMSDNS